MLSIKKIYEFEGNFPIDGEAYAVGELENGIFFFAWGSEFPYADELPPHEILNGESGFSFYSAIEDALSSMVEAVSCWD